MRFVSLQLVPILLLGIAWLAAPMAGQAQETQLTAPSGNEDDFFGRSVAISADGSTALIGADGDEDIDGNDDKGSAYVFRINESGSWAYEDKLTAFFDGVAGDKFGTSVALNADGTFALIGARNDGGNFNTGSAYVFAQDEEGTWLEQAELGDPNSTSDVIGYPVALSNDGSIVLIRNTIFVRDDSGNWTQQTDLIPPGGVGDINYGSAVALSPDGSTALITADNEQIADNVKQGSAYVFTTDGSGTWAFQEQLVADDGDGYDTFGTSAALGEGGSVAVIGADEDEVDGTTFRGSAYVFARDDMGNWSQQTQLLASDGGEDDQFGFSAALNADGSSALIGAYGDKAYLFSEDDTGNWTEQMQLMSSEVEPGDVFGGAVSFDAANSTALVGATSDDVDGVSNQGSAYVFSVSSGTNAPTATTEAATNITETTAQLNGTVNPNGAETSVDFVYYPTGQPGLGQTIAADQSPLTGTSEQDVSATAEFLQGDTEYTYVVSAENSEGLTNGSEVTLTTEGGTDPVTIAVTETIGVTDDVQVTPPVTITVAETITVSDEPTVQLPVQITVNETVTVTDAPQVTPPATISVAETINVTDATGVSPVIAIATSTVESSGEVDFGGTGISIDFAGVGGSGDVTVTKFGDPPDGTDGISLPSVSPYRYTIKTEGTLSVGPGTEIRFDVGTLAGLDDPEEITIFKRPTAGTGRFSALPTTFDAKNNLLIATTESFSEFALASDEGRMPVELTRFDAEADGETVHLSWRTASETRNAGFGIERSRGETGAWTQIGFVEGHGTTSEPQDYRFIDRDLPYEADRLSYRLKLVDLDGGFDYSPTVEVALRIPDELALRGNFPNPFAEQTTIRYALPQSGPVRLTIYDMLGRRVATLVDDHQAAGRHQATFAPRNLASGTYLVRLSGAGATRTQKITVVR
ncbi:MAG: T9SS type A sorting domain-containing protein [Bacteroidetes bacterium]|jgi:hypothetical protein|nr:T9SS type A sorting domain-containing protein [Bacteroidota bacterium]